MGWSGGTEIMNGIIKVIEKEINADEDFKKKVAIYDGIIDVLEDGDWDTQMENLGESKAFDEALLERMKEDL